MLKPARILRDIWIVPVYVVVAMWIQGPIIEAKAGVCTTGLICWLTQWANSSLVGSVAVTLPPALFLAWILSKMPAAGANSDRARQT